MATQGCVLTDFAWMFRPVQPTEEENLRLLREAVETTGGHPPTPTALEVICRAYLSLIDRLGDADPRGDWPFMPLYWGPDQLTQG